jgi:hypothetical protein
VDNGHKSPLKLAEQLGPVKIAADASAASRWPFTDRTMTAESALNWAAVATVTLSLVVGLAMLTTTTYAYARTLTIAASGLLFAFLGAFLMTTSKWSEVAFKWGDWEARLAKAAVIETKFATLVKEKETLAAQAAAIETKFATLVKEKQSLAALVADKTMEISGLQKANAAISSERDQLKMSAQNAFQQLQGVSSGIPSIDASTKEKLDAVIMDFGQDIKNIQQ